MSWSFSFDMSNQLNQVRSMIGDVDTTDQQISDEEIIARLANGPLAAGSVYLAAAQCCEAIASAYARQTNLKIGNTSANLEPRMEHYRQRAKDLRAQNIRFGGVVPFSGGISISTNQAAESDPDRIPPSFTTTTGDDQGGSSGTLPSVGAWWPI